MTRAKPTTASGAASTAKVGAGEDTLTPTFDRELVARLWPFVRPYRLHLLGALIVLPVASLLSLLQPWLLQRTIDDHLVAQQWEGLPLLAALFALTLLAEYGLRYLQMTWTEIAGQRALRDLRCRVFEHLQGRSIRYFHRQPVGRLMARLTADVDALQEALSSGLVTIIGDLVTLIGIVSILIYMSATLAGVTFAVVPLLLGLTFVFRVLMRRAYRRLRVLIAQLNAYLNEAVTGMRIIQLFRGESRAYDGYDAINRQHRDSALSAIRFDALLFALVEMFSSIAVAGILWFGAGQSVRGVITIGGLIAFIEYAQKFFIPIRDLSQTYTVLQSAMASSERIFQVLDTDEAIEEAPDAAPLATIREGIEFRDVWFAYDDEQWVLRGVSFTVRRGERIALVGHTGAGKSTIVQLLTRMYDIQRGQILVDGVDIRRLQLADLRARFATVLQDGFLFEGTIRENITLGTPHVRAEDVESATRVVGLDRLLARYTDGMDHPVRERGSNLSGGERQLVTFARALAHRPDVLVLDEATANVDTETEALIQAAIDALLARQTSVVVAHRLSTIQQVDRIIVLHAGVVDEIGTHASLLAQGGRYARLVRLQFGGDAMPASTR
jgi:ATP-binding cassette subfamily B protein